MKLLRNLVPLLLTVALVVTSPLAAFAQSADGIDAAALGRYGISCSANLCTVEVKLPKNGIGEYKPLVHSTLFALDVLEENLRLLPDGAGLEVKDALSFTFPLGGFTLLDADVTIEVDADGVMERMVGTASAPPLAILDVGPVRVPTTVKFGYDQGRSLSFVDAPLIDDHSYLYLQVGQPTPSYALLQQGARSTFATIVADVATPFLYIDSAASIRSSALALMETLLPMNPMTESLIDSALTPQQAGVRFTALWTGDRADSYMKLHTAYSINGGFLSRWLPFEFTPLALDSFALVDGSGLRLTASAQSTVAPSVLADGGLQAEIFVPFEAGQPSNIILAAKTQAPLMGLDLAGSINLREDATALAQALAGMSRSALAAMSATTQATAGAAADAASSMADASGRAYYWAADSSGWVLSTLAESSGWAISTLANSSGQAISSVADTTGGIFSWITDASGQALSATADASGQAFSALGSVTDQAVNATVGATSQAIDSTVDAASWAYSQAADAAGRAAEASGQAIDSSVDATGQAYSWAANLANRAASTVVDAPGWTYSAIAESNVVDCGGAALRNAWCGATGWCEQATVSCDAVEVAGLNE